MSHKLPRLCIPYLLLTLATAFAATTAATAAKSTPAPQPNIILIVVDDLGWTDLGIYGSDLYLTPQIDRLAGEGMRFDNAYAASPVCSPTRASILTGKYPARLGLTDWIPGYPDDDKPLPLPNRMQQLAPEEFTLAEILREAGYRTGHIGKWHLGDDETEWPEHQGFDVNIGGWSKGQPNSRGPGEGYFSPYANPRLSDGPDGEYLTNRLAREAVKFIEQSHGQPFFLNLWFYNVHTPLQAQPHKISRYQRALRPGAHHFNPTYAAMVEHTDDAVGQVLTALEKLQLAQDTIIVLTSDNGGLIGTWGKPGAPPSVTSNHPLRSGKGDIYEGGVRVPFILRYPGHIPAGNLSTTITTSPDILPTLLSLAHIDLPAPLRPTLDGVDLSPVLLGNAPTIDRQAIYFHYPHYHPEGATPFSAIRQGDWKLIETLEDHRLQLYNLATDPSEQQDQAQSNPHLRDQLYANLRAWRKSVDAPMPKPHDPRR